MFSIKILFVNSKSPLRLSFYIANAEFNRANREVAILCNHQRSQPKQHMVQMEKMNEKIAEIEEEIRLVKSLKKDLKAGGSVEEFSRKRKRDEVEVEEGDDEKPEKKKARLPSTPEKCEELVRRLEERVCGKESEK